MIVSTPAGGFDLRNLLIDYVRKVPADFRTILLPFVYGLFGGLAAVAFQKVASIVFSIFWEMPPRQMQRGVFAFFSLATILMASIIADLILTFLSRDGAGKRYSAGQGCFLERFRIYASKGGDSEVLCRRALDRSGLQSRARRSDLSCRGGSRIEYCGMAWHCQTGTTAGPSMRCR